MLLSLDYGIDDKWSQIFYIPKTVLKDLYISCRSKMFTYEVLNRLNELHTVNVHENKRSSIFEIGKVS